MSSTEEKADLKAGHAPAGLLTIIVNLLSVLDVRAKNDAQATAAVDLGQPLLFSAGQRFQPHANSHRRLGGLEQAVESTTVTHSSADWWDLLLPLA